MRVCVLSPHRDDAAFSCGLLLVSLLRQGGELSIVNVCTFSAYAPYLDATDMHRVTQVTSARATEDGMFITNLLSVSGAAFEQINLVDLQWQDAPLRNHYPDEQVLTSAVNEQDRIALSKVFSTLSATDLLLVPAGIGDHVDHLLVRDAATSACSSSKMLFYEDLPYACRHQSFSCPFPFNELEKWLGPPVHVKNAKRDLALQYPSQIAGDVAEELQLYADSLGGRERFYGAPEAVRTMTAAFPQ